MRFTTAAAAAAALSFGSIAYAQTAQRCPSTNVCYSLNLPSDTASSGSGDVFFQLSAPTTYSWVALGQGSSMSGANIFVMYTDSSGTNVTLSPRLGTGEVEPKFDSAAQVTLLAGSGVSNGIMTANVRCSNCESWSGGTMDFTGTSGTFIHAEKSGDQLDSDDTSEDLVQHGSPGSSFSFDFSSATGGDSVNPFTSDSSASSGSASSGTAASTASGAATTSTAATTCTSTSEASTTSSIDTGTGTNCPTAWPTQYSTSWPSSYPTQYAGCSFAGHSYWPRSAPVVTYVKYVKRETCDDGSSNSGSSGSTDLDESGVPFGGDENKANTIMIAHGVMASLAFVILFPAGGIMIRLLSFPGLIWLHAIFQVLGYLIFVIGAGLGIYLATQLRYLNQAHPIIGLVLLAVLVFQPILGLVHHKMFKKHSRRTVWSYAHLWLGRAAIVLGMVNGGLGLKLAANAHRGEIAYGVIAAIMFVAYVAAILIGESKRRRATRNRGDGDDARHPPTYAKAMRMEQLSSEEEIPRPPRYA